MSGDAISTSHATPATSSSAGLAELVARDELARAVLGEGDILTFGRFELVRRLGAGGMGTVFEARDPELDRRFALKLLHGHLRDSSEARTRLRREGRALAKLSHPNIVQVFESGEVDGTPFVAMELVAGTTLRSWIAAERSSSAKIDVFLQAGRALAEAHRHGIVHRDFKPENVLVDERAHVRVVDFGVAGLVDRAIADDTGPSSEPAAADSGVTVGPVGTPRYMAPEQRAGAPAVTSSDQFSYCLVFHEALFGVSTADGHAIARILRRGMAVDPQQRWPDMDALLRAITRARRRRSMLLAAGGIAAAMVATVAAAAVQDQRCAQWAESHRAAWRDHDREAVVSGLATADVVSPHHGRSVVVDRLGAYIDELASVDREQCPALIDLGSSPTAIATCLDARHAGVATLVELLAGADSSVASASANAVANLPSPRSCVDADATQDDDIPLDPAFERDIAAVAVSCWSARFERCRDHATEIADRARERGRRRDEARAQLQRAFAHRELGAHEEARDDNLAAFYTFVEIGDGLNASNCAVQLAAHFAMVRHDPQWVQHWAAMARSLDGDERLSVDQRINLADARAVVSSTREQEEEILADLRGLAAAVEREPAATRAHLHGALGFLLDRMDRLDEAELEWQRFYEQTIELEGPSHPRVGDAAVNLASVLRRREKLDAAVAMGREAVAVYEAALPAGHLDIARARLNLAAALADLGQTELSLAEHEIVVDMLAGKGDDPVLAQAYHNIAVLADGQGNHEYALVRARQALDAYSSVFGASDPAVIPSLVTAIEIHEARGDDVSRLVVGARYLEVVAQAGERAELDAAEWGWTQMARAHHGSGDHEGERRAYDRAVEEAEKIRASDAPELRELVAERARCRQSLR